MEAALKPTGDWPGGHSIWKDGLLSLLSPTSRKEFRIDPALHGDSHIGLAANVVIRLSGRNVSSLGLRI